MSSTQSKNSAQLSNSRRPWGNRRPVVPSIFGESFFAGWRCLPSVSGIARSPRDSHETGRWAEAIGDQKEFLEFRKDFPDNHNHRPPNGAYSGRTIRATRSLRAKRSRESPLEGSKAPESWLRTRDLNIQSEGLWR